MQTKHNNHDFKIEWQYESPVLNKLLEEKNISKEQAFKMKRVELRKALGVESLPLPTLAKCKITNASTEETVASVANFEANKNYSKNEMRKVTMGNALRIIFPGAENKPARKVFFDSYLNRTVSSGLKRFLRLYTKYESELAVLQNQITEKDVAETQLQSIS